MTSDVQLAPELVKLPPGAYVMGETPDDKFATDTERPAHRVIFGCAFALGKFPVTVGDYRVFAPEHASHDNPQWPVVNVSWDDAQTYCAWLRSETGDPFRLPSEAEWEYACRAGTQSPFSLGGEITPADANYLYSEYGERIGVGARTPVRHYSPNGFGLFDLHGNVCEWVEDGWHAGYTGAPTDGSPWIAAGGSDRRVIRGGAWDYLPRLLRSAWRDSLPANHRRDNLGFRIARTL